MSETTSLGTLHVPSLGSHPLHPIQDSHLSSKATKLIFLIWRLLRLTNIILSAKSFSLPGPWFQGAIMTPISPQFFFHT